MFLGREAEPKFLNDKSALEIWKSSSIRLHKWTESHPCSEIIEKAERNCHNNHFYFELLCVILQIKNLVWGGDTVEKLNAIGEQVV